MPKGIIYKKIFAKSQTATSGAITGSGTAGRLAKFTASGVIGNSVVFSETDGTQDYVTLIHATNVNNATSIRGSNGNVRLDMGNNGTTRFFVSTDNHVAATSHLYFDQTELYFIAGNGTGTSNAFFGGGTDFMYFDVNNQQNAPGVSQIFLSPTETQINTLPLMVNGVTTTLKGGGNTFSTYSLIVQNNSGASNSMLIADDAAVGFGVVPSTGTTLWFNFRGQSTGTNLVRFGIPTDTSVYNFSSQGVFTSGHASDAIHTLYRKNTTASPYTMTARLNFDFNNASSAQTTYSSVYGSIVSNAAGSENGALQFLTTKNGSLAEKGRIDEDGYFILTANNAAIADADLANSRMSFYIDESADTFIAKVKYSTGTVKTFSGSLT